MTRRILLPATITLTLMAAACGTTASTALTESEYVELMGATCLITVAELDALPTPPGEITVAEFATRAAAAIGNEAERARTFDAPEDLAADHRAFIANTDQQASRWVEIAGITGGDSAELNRLSEEIAQLTLGRDDLVDEMGIVDCRRAPT